MASCTTSVQMYINLQVVRTHKSAVLTTIGDGWIMLHSNLPIFPTIMIFLNYQKTS